MSTQDRIAQWKARRSGDARKSLEERVSFGQEAKTEMAGDDTALADDGEKADAPGAQAPASATGGDDTVKAGTAPETTDSPADRAAAMRAALSGGSENAERAAKDGNPFEDPAREEAQPASARGAAPAAATGAIINRDLPTGETIDAARRTADARRRLLTRRRRMRLLLLVGIPALLYALYTLVFVEPRYESSTVFSVTTAGGDSGAMAQPALGIGGPSPTLAEEYEMRAFLTSREVMERMEEQHGYLSHLQSAADGIGGVRGVGGLRDPLAYYQSRVNVTINVQEGLAVLKVRANTQADAERYAGYLIGYARARLADTAQQLNTDQLEGLQEEVATARNEVNEAANALGEVQQARGELDPVAAASAVYQLIGGLELRLTEVRAQRDSLLSNGLDRSPLLPRLNAQIATLERQIDEQRARLAGDGSQSVQRSALLLERARARKELADATLAATLQTMEQARVEALKRREYLVVIAPPSAPLLPNVGRTARAISWLILLAVLAGVIWVAWQRLRERRRNDADDALWDEED